MFQYKHKAVKLQAKWKWVQLVTVRKSIKVEFAFHVDPKMMLISLFNNDKVYVFLSRKQAQIKHELFRLSFLAVLFCNAFKF